MADQTADGGSINYYTDTTTTGCSKSVVSAAASFGRRKRRLKVQSHTLDQIFWRHRMY